jgi:hypothetical protein
LKNEHDYLKEMTMDYKKYIDDIIKTGATIHVAYSGRPFVLILGAVQWLENPKRLKWSAIFPEHQGHIHRFEYDRVEIDWDRDVRLLDKDSKTLVGITVADESPMDADVVKSGAAEWQRMLSLHNNREQQAEFMDEN